MTEAQILLEGWEYDLWANKLWVEAAAKMPSPERPLEVLEHIATSQWIWLLRACPFITKPEGPLEQRFERMNELWVTVVKDDDMRRMIDYHSLAGVPYRTELGAIIRQTIDHGTYHRGHLRGLAEMQGWSDFPETGYLVLFRTLGIHQ